MQGKLHRSTRWTEVFTGLLFIVLSLSYIASLLLDFNFVSLYATPQEDLAYLSEQATNQGISSYSWMVTAFLSLFSLPFYVSSFRGHMRIWPLLNGLFILGAAAGFFMMARTGLDMKRELEIVLKEGLELDNNQLAASLLEQYRLEQFYRHLGSTCVGAFAVGLGLSKFKVKGFPLFSTVLLLVSGPVLIVFNWMDPDHLARTGAMAGVILGMVLFCIRLINKGLGPP
jgi:hypothetical protein